LQAFFAQKTREECLDWLTDLDVCFAPVNTLLEALDDANVRARSAVFVDDAGRRHLAPPIRFAAEPAQPRLKVPSLGEHTEEILADLDADEGAW
jgi:crotonobetainyl-CoA:carnitine CoA-transferase CaiB-like acyl-CoA transferase